MHLPFPRVPLAITPTPLQPLRTLSRMTGVDLWLKRDDLSGDIGLSGNKVRKLEYLLGQALEDGATCVLTTGGPQSNHARATAAAAARLNLRCVLILAGRPPGAEAGNLLLNQLFGAEIRFPGAITPEDQARCLGEAATELALAGEKPYIIPVGGSTPIGTLGALHCYEEIREQIPDPGWICCATGSGGTHAGLALGQALHGDGARVQGFSVWQPTEMISATTRALVHETAQLLGRPIGKTEIHVDDRFLAPRYGKASPGALEAIELLARMEGVVLDHIYTGKAMAGLLAYIRQGLIRRGERVVFVHTGGVPAIFAGMS